MNCNKTSSSTRTDWVVSFSLLTLRKRGWGLICKCIFNPGCGYGNTLIENNAEVTAEELRLFSLAGQFKRNTGL